MGSFTLNRICGPRDGTKGDPGEAPSVAEAVEVNKGLNCPKRVDDSQKKNASHTKENDTSNLSRFNIFQNIINMSTKGRNVT